LQERRYYAGKVGKAPKEVSGDLLAEGRLWATIS
jgi:hypothetical protein